jgi:hypothetical protein
MQVFLSWSKPRSKAIATALHKWLPNILQGVEPWMSEKDIDAGRRWSDEIAKRLETSQFGVLCLTPENFHEPWMLFEAGALAKKVDLARVVPYLYDLEPAHLTGSPLGTFQAKQANRSGSYDLVMSLNKGVEKPLDNARLRETFDLWWAKWEKDLSVNSWAWESPRRRSQANPKSLTRCRRRSRKSCGAP